MLLKFFISILLLLTLFSPSYSLLKYPPYDTYDTLLEQYNIFFQKNVKTTQKTQLLIYGLLQMTPHMLVIL